MELVSRDFDSLYEWGGDGGGEGLWGATVFLYWWYFLVPFLGASLYCFVLDLGNPGWRVAPKPRREILADYGVMAPSVVGNLVVAGPYFYGCLGMMAGRRGREWPVVLNMVLWLLTTDVFFYYIHRAFHLPRLYWLHAKHHQFRQTYGAGAIYASVPDFVLANLVPGSVPFVLWGMPYWFACYVTAAATVYTVVFSHGGHRYVMLGKSHLLHHLRYKVNYGLVLMDRVCGTYKRFE